MKKKKTFTWITVPSNHGLHIIYVVISRGNDKNMCPPHPSFGLLN